MRILKLVFLGYKRLDYLIGVYSNVFREIVQESDEIVVEFSSDHAHLDVIDQFVRQDTCSGKVTSLE